jgi:hypothetical protein
MNQSTPNSINNVYPGDSTLDREFKFLDELEKKAGEWICECQCVDDYSTDKWRVEDAYVACGPDDNDYHHTTFVCKKCKFQAQYESPTHQMLRALMVITCPQCNQGK